MAATQPAVPKNVDELRELLKNDIKVKVAGTSPDDKNTTADSQALILMEFSAAR